MTGRPCWEIKECGLGPDSNDPCPAVDYELADGFLESKNGSRVCFYIKGTRCFENDEHMRVTEKLATYCMDCEVYKEVVKEHGVAANLFYYIKHIHDRLEKSDRIEELPVINKQLFHS